MNTFPSKNIIDISPSISPRLAVFPGDEVFSRQVSLDMKQGDHLTLSSITTTLHIGSHTDAPSHYARDGASIDQRDLSLYLGPCQVVRMQKLRPGQRIYPEDLAGKDISAERILFYTGSFHEELWSEDFNALSPELIEFLHKKGVVLVGIDTPSVDPASSKDLESHAALSRFDIAVLEGIVLEDVPEAFYTLIALPLKIEGADASPVRAVLISR